jgi:hypothetical protein
MRDSTSYRYKYQVPSMKGFSKTSDLFYTGHGEATAITNLYPTPTEHYVFGDEYYSFAHG